MEKKCSVNIPQVLAYIKDRVGKDVKFKNFDEVAKDILNTKGQPDDAKMIVLKALANMYKSLASKNPEFVIDKKADLILNTPLQTADLSALHNDVRKSYLPGAAKVVSINTSDDLIEYVEKLKDLSDYELIEGSKIIFSSIGVMLNKGSLMSKMTMKNNLLFAITRFEELIKANSNVLDKTKDIIQKKLNSIKVDVTGINSYAPLNTTKYGEAFRIYDKNSKLIDQVYLNKQDGQYYSLSNPTKQIDVQALKDKGFSVEQIIYDTRLSSRFETVEHGRVRLLNSKELTAGLSLGRFTNEGLKQALLSVSDPNNFITVVASKVNIKQNQERLKRIQEDIPGRNHETFESYEQQLALRDGNSIATVSSPTKGVSLRIEGPGVEGLALIYDITNYVIVNSDNTTEAIDFSDPAQRELIKKYFKKTGANQTAVELSDYDLQRLASLHSVISQFKNIAADYLEKNGGDEVELPKELYKDVISLGKTDFNRQAAAVKSEQEGALLSSALEDEKNKKWMVEVDVVKTDDTGAEIGREKRSVPILVKKVQREWQFVNGVLDDNEFVDYNGELLPLEIYLNNVYPDAKNVHSIVPGFPQHIGYAMILPKNELSNNYQVIGMNRDYGADPVMNFLKFIHNLNNLKKEISKNPSDQNRLTKSFNIEQYGFSPAYGWGSDLASYVDKKGEVTFHYEIRPLSNKTLNDDSKLKSASRLVFGQGVMDEVTKFINKNTTSESFKKFLADNYPQFGSMRDLVDSKTGELGQVFFNVVSKYIESKPDLKKDLEGMYDVFTSALARNMENVQKKFREAGYGEQPSLYTMLENESKDLKGRWFLKVNDKSVNLNFMNLDQFRLTTTQDLAKASNLYLESPIATYLSEGSTQQPTAPVTPPAAPVVQPASVSTDTKTETKEEYVFRRRYKIFRQLKDKYPTLITGDTINPMMVQPKYMSSEDIDLAQKVLDTKILELEYDAELVTLEGGKTTQTSDIAKGESLVREMLSNNGRLYTDFSAEERGLIDGISIERKEEIRKEIETKETPGNTTHKITEMDEDPFSLVGVDEPVVMYNDQSYKSELDWFNKNMPADFKLEDLSKIIGNLKAEGQILGYYKDLTLYVSKALSGEGSIYHEAFHGIFRNVLSDKDRSFYIGKALQELGQVTKADVEKFRKERGKFHLSDAQVIQGIAEEYLADGYKSYKLNKVEPAKGWLAKFVRLIDKIIKFFTGKSKDIDAITELFNRIDTGYYKNATVVQNFKGEGVFQIIPSRPVITGTKADGTPLIRKSYMNTYEQNQLLYRIAFEVANSPINNFDLRFDFAVSKLLQEYDIEKLVADNSGLDEQKIRNKYTQLYDDYRFILGDPFSTYKNESGVESHDAIISEVDRSSLGTLALLKGEVKNILTNIDMRSALLSDDFQFEEDNDEDKPNGSYEDNYANLNPLDGLSRQFRKFFSLLPYEYKDKDTGVTVTKMVDGSTTFDAIMKISADVPYDSIIENLRSVIDSLGEEGEKDAYNKLNTVFKYMDEKFFGLTEDFKPTRNFNLYNQFISTFFVTEVSTEIIHATTNSDYGTRGKVYDATIQRDISREIEKLKIGYTSFFRMPSDVKQQIFKQASSVIKQEVLASLDLKTENAVELERKAKVVQSALAQIGLNFSKSMIKFSLVNIDKINNPLKEFSSKSTASKLIKNNPILASSGAYLKKDFFTWVFGATLGPDVNIFERTDYDNINLDPEDLEEKDIIKEQRSPQQKTQIDGIAGILKDAARFMIKYNPNAAVSVFQDAQNKNVYRYLKYTPLLLMAQTVKNKGLQGLIDEYPIFEDWFKDNPYFNSKDKELKLYLDNFSISMLGGSRQSIEKFEKEGITFKNMDPRSKQIADLILFSNRTIVTSGKTQIVTYKRSHSILEATSTNFMVPSMYQQLYTKEGFKKDEKGNILVLDAMMKSIQQEYNRIQREWSTREERKTTGNKSNYDGYNAKKGEDDSINTTDDTLRAYNFNTFAKFFGKTSYVHPDSTIQADRLDIGERLIENAKAGIPFKDILKKERYSDELTKLKSLLEGYAVDEFYDYLDNLAATGVINPLEKGGFTSELIPTSVKTGPGNYASLDQMNHNLESFLADYFYNDWMSRVFVSQFFDGDAAVTTESATKYGLRNRFAVIKGDSMRDGFHTVAYINKLKVWMHKSDIEAGQYDNIDDVPEEYRIDDNWKNNWEKVDVADGQSYTTVEHRIDMYNKQGRIEEDRSLDNDEGYSVSAILQKSRIERLTNEEIKYIEKFKVVLGSYKTATGGMIEYHKLSEHILLRTDVSYIKPLGTDSIEDSKKLLKSLYSEADRLREYINQGNESILIPEYNATPREALKEIYNDIHSLFQPRPGREMLHNMLNSMEMHGIDQLIDVNASKKGTLLAIDLVKDGITDLSLSSKQVPNKFKMMQVETSGVSRKITNPTQKQQLIDADIDISDESDVPKDLKNAVKNYRKALEQHSMLSLNDIKLILDRPDGEVNITPIIATMRKGLEQQGADANILKFFEIDEKTGKPVYNINLPMRKAMFQNYFFSLYSDNVFGGKVSGRKDFEVSSFGYKLVVDENDNVIKQDEIDKNPEKYAGYKTRYPGVKIEIDENDNITYVVEVIIPKPLFNSKQEEELYLRRLTKMISTRIPTEDKRSMVVAKVVDYIDGSYQNAVIVPQLIHKLAGSDLDIDALYSQTLATYEDLNGKMHVYGEYDTHEGLETEEAKFLEYLLNRSESDIFAGDIDLEYDRILNDTDSITELPDAMEKLKDYLGLPGLGINKENIKERIKELNEARRSYYTTYQTVKQARQEVYDLYVKLRSENEAIWEPAFKSVVRDLKEAGEKFDESDEQFQRSVSELVYNRLSESDRKKIDWKGQGKLSSELRRYEEQAKMAFNIMTGGNAEYADARKEAKKVIKMFEKQLRMIATMNVLAKYKQPVNINDFKKRTKEYVKEVVQNNNMKQQMNILGSAYVFNYLYKNEESSVKSFKDLGKALNESIDTKVEAFDRHTPTFGVNVMGINSNSEGGIGIAATANKATAFMTKFGVRLLKPIWEINGEVYKEYTAYSTDDKDITRVIKSIGKALGMFADAKKEPYPSILNLNETTAGVSLGMIAQGVPETAAYLINKIPLIEQSILESERKASGVQTVQEYYERNNLKKTLNRAMDIEVANIIKSKEKELLFAKDKSGKFTDKLRPIVLSFNFDIKESRTRENLEDLGFTAVYKGTDERVPDNVLQIHLIDMYIKQLDLNNDVLALGKILNLIKKQEPSWKNLDDIVRSYMYLTNRLSRTPNFTNMKDILENRAKEYKPLIEAVLHLYSTSEKVFLERNPVFKIINEELENSMYSFGMSDTILSNLNSYPVKFLLVNKFKQRTQEQLDSEMKSENPREELIEKLKNRLSMLSADFWMNKDTELTPTLEDDVNYLQKEYPDNAFANFIKTRSLNGVILTEALTRMKLDSEMTNSIIDGYNLLQRSLDKRTRIIADKLYMYLLVKDNLGMSNNSFINYLNPSLYKSVSQDLDEIQKILNQTLVSKKGRDRMVKGEPFKEFFNNKDLDLPALLSNIYFKAMSHVGNRSFLHSSRMFLPGALKGILSSKLSRLKSEDLLDLMSKVVPMSTSVNLNELYELTVEDRLYDVYTPDSKELDKGTAIVDMSIINDPGDIGLPPMQEELARALKVSPLYKYESDGKKVFTGWSFPGTVVNSQGQLLRLDSIDGKPVGQFLVEKLNDRLINTRLNSDYAVGGMRAVYKVSQFEGTDRILNTVFSTEDARDLYEFVESSRTYSMVKTTEEFDKFIARMYSENGIPIPALELLQKWVKKDFDKYGYIKFGNKGVYTLKYSKPVSEYEPDNQYVLELRPSDKGDGSTIVGTLFLVTNGAHRQTFQKEFKAVEYQTLSKEERKKLRLAEEERIRDEKAMEATLRLFPGLTREEAIERGLIPDPELKKPAEGTKADAEALKYYASLLGYINGIKTMDEYKFINGLQFNINFVKSIPEGLFNNVADAIEQRGDRPFETPTGDMVIPDFLQKFTMKKEVKAIESKDFTESDLKTIYDARISKTDLSFDDFKNKASDVIVRGEKNNLTKEDIIDALKCL